MDPQFLSASNRVSISLSPAWEWLTHALGDCFGTLAPAGSTDTNPSTFWIDRALTLMERSDGSPVELASGNMSHFSLAGDVVTVSADYDTFEDCDISTWAFTGLLKQWRSAVQVASAQLESAYDDDYATCARTYASLRVFTDGLDPDGVTQVLGCQPTNLHRKGDPVGRSGHTYRPMNGWFLSSKDSVSSDDLRRHIDWLLDRVDTTELGALHHERDAQSDVFCYWESTSGHGGPSLNPGQMIRLADLGLSINIDTYFPG